MTGVCGREEDKQVIWELSHRESGSVELRFCAEEEGAGISDYSYEISTMLPPWADYVREITEIIIDGKIEVIGKHCFRGMDHLQKVEFLSDGAHGSHLRVIGAKAFQDCRSLTEIRIPDSVEEIGGSAFHSNECLSRVWIGSGLKKLGADAFACDVSLETLHIDSAQLMEVGKSQFKLNHRLKDFVCRGDSAGAVELKNQYDQIYCGGGVEEVLVEDSQDLSRSPEENLCGNLTETIRYQLTPVGGDNYCLEITGTGAMPDWISRASQPWKSRAGRITQVRVGEGVTSIGDAAFSALTALTNVELPDTIESVGTVAFGECSSLKEIRFHEGMKILGCRSLWACASLETLYLPETFRVADLFATSYCPALNHVCFAGSEALWKQKVIIDNMMERNSALKQDRIYFEKESERCEAEKANPDVCSEQYRQELNKIAELIKSLGDGLLHVIAVNLGDGYLLSKSGDSTLIIFPKGSTMLIDTGASGVRNRLIGLLKEIQLERLDYLVFTHPHGDHFGGAMDVINYFLKGREDGIREAWYSGAAMDNAGVHAAMQALKESGVQLREVKVEEDFAGEHPARMNIDGVEIFVYGPNEQDIRAVNAEANVETSNNVSVVLKFRFGETIFFTGGDIYRNKERYLIETYGPETFRADVIKMNHHGNFQGNIPEWISATQPKVAYAETDGNGNSDVMRRYTRAGAVCYSTGLDGMLHITMGPEKEITVYHQFDSTLREFSKQ